jgi:hypothetical protein
VRDGGDYIVVTLSERRDPDGSKVQRVLTTHFAYERSRTIRNLLVHLLAATSVLVWRQAVWAIRMIPEGRAVALAAWAVAFAGLAVTATSAWHWRWRRGRYLSDRQPPPGNMPR